jgi:hypothetical protein
MSITMTYRFLRHISAAVLLALILELGWTGVVWSQKPPVPLVVNPLAPNLKAPAPVGMQRGTTLDLTLTGTNLTDPTGVWTSFPATVTIPTDGPNATNGKDPAKLLVRLQVPADAPVGFHMLRLTTRRGISNLRLFCIDDLQQVLRAPNNRTRATAQELQPPCVVVGKIDAEVSDWYKIKVQANQRLSFEVLGRRLGSAVDPQLTLYDAKSGRELPEGRSDDAPGLQTDPRLTYTFKEAGEVLIEIRDVSFRGAEDFHYRLRIGDFPCATTPLPMAAKRGSKATITFAGPSGDLAAPVAVQAPTDPSIPAIWVAPRGANGLHGWPVSLMLSDLDEILEQEPNNEPAKANRLTIPAAVTGRFQEKNDIDHFVFAAKKGQRLIIDAQTTDLHSPTEVYMVLRDSKGAQLQASNPAAAPRLDYPVPIDGDLVLAVEHLHLWGGPAETYRITITPYEPGFDLAVTLDRFDVTQGGTFSLPVQVVRRDYAGPIELSVVSKGLTGQATIAAAQPFGVLPITAAADMAVGPTTFLIAGKATINGKMVTEYASIRVPVSQSMSNLPVPPRAWYQQFGLAVTEKPPFALAAKFDSPMAVPGMPAPFTITATRAPNFTGEIALTAAGLPGNVTAALKNIPAGQNEIKVQLAFAPAAAVGMFNFTVTGKAKHNNYDYSVNVTVPLVVKK